MKTELPLRVLSWYGDDFTGSTDVLEALAPYMPSVLFLRRPHAKFFSQFSDYGAFGLAGTSRSETPEWMDANLAPAFDWLRSLGTAICHYKVCSTFDSSAEIGNIGRAIEIGKQCFSSSFVPIVVGAPSLGRYTTFGNLFASVDGIVHRIDRHPTMKCHPVTPMKEADLRLHLAHQTNLRIELLDVLQLASSQACELYRSRAESADAVLIDVMDDNTLQRAGRLLWSSQAPPFVVGSSGVEYALLAHWKEQNLLEEDACRGYAPPADRIVVLSGSCSPVTARQIHYAGRNGFDLARLDALELTNGERPSRAMEQACSAGLATLSRGRSLVLYTAASPQDRIDRFDSAAAQRDFRHKLSQRAGEVLNRIVDESGVRRVVIAGGDTSSHAGRLLGVDALTFISHLAPGAPLCHSWSENPDRHDLEIVFKGGQCGKDDFFETVVHGGTKGGNS